MEQSEEKRKLVKDIKSQLINCIGFEGDELQTSREEAYKYYFQRPRGDEVAGRSEIVTGDLSSMVEGNLAQMTEPLSKRRIAEFCAYDGPDEEQAQIESDCVNEMLFKRQNGFIEVTSAVKSAMLLRNAVCKVYIDERTFKKTVRKENVEPEIINELLEQIRKQQTINGTEVSVDVHKYDKANKKFSATVRKTVKTFKCEAVAPENLLVPKFWDKHSLAAVPFCAERHTTDTRATLIERGFDKAIVAAIPKYSPTKVTQNVRLPNGLTANNANAIDTSQEIVEWYECYSMMDDGEGASELRRICIAGNLLLDDSPVDFIQYAAGAIIINPHSYIAISLHDKLKSTQDTTVALTRALMDNLNTTSKNRSAHLDGVVEETDITDGRTNGSIRVKPNVGIMDVRQAFATFSVPDTSGNILQNLEHARRTRSEMGGATLDMSTGQMQLSDRVGSQGLDRAYSVMEMLASFMIKTVANTLIRDMYLIAHETLRTQWKGPISFKRGNEWIKQNPSDWQARTAVQVNIGESLGERARQAVVLEKVMLKQETLAAAGMEGILVDAETYFNAYNAWLRVNDIPNPEKYMIDPRSDRSKQEFKNKAIARRQQQQKQDSMLQQAVGLEQVRVALDKYKNDSELQYKYWSDVIKAQIEEAKLTMQGVLDLLKAKNEAKEAKENGTNSGSKETGGNGARPKSAAGNDSSGVSE